MSEENNTAKKDHVKYYALTSFFISLLIGFLYTWLFAWKTVGISHLLFSIAFIFFSIVPVFIIEKENAFKRFNVWIVPSILSTILSISFLYRLDPIIMVVNFILIPIVNLFLIIFMFYPTKIWLFSFFKSLILPFKLLIAWFSDLVSFFKNLDFGLIKSEKLRSIIKRVFLGCISGGLVALVVLPLLVFADQMFAKIVSDLLSNIFGDWFKDIATFFSSFTKVILMLSVSSFSSVFLFGLWNKESSLSKAVEEGVEPKEYLRNWDIISTSVFMAILNSIFLLFIYVQFKYLFGGENNILQEGAVYSYAEYARKGFGELLTVSLISYFILLLLHLKVYSANLTQTIVYRVNYFLLFISILVIGVSAVTRLNLVVANYGMTDIRLLGYVTYVVVGLLYLMLFISTFFKSRLSFLKLSNLVLISLVFMYIVFFPADYFVAKVNSKRFESTSKIDLPYLLSMSDESLSVQMDLAIDKKSTLITQTLLLANLESRYEYLQTNRKDWQSFNFLQNYLLERAAYLIDKDNLRKNRDLSNEQLSQFLDSYSEEIRKGNYQVAYEEFWSKNSKPLDFSDLKKIKVNKYDITNIPAYDDWVYTNLSASENSSYWNGMQISVDTEYDIVNELYEIYDRSGSSLGSVTNSQKLCGYDNLTVVIENGEWKIINASSFTLGNFKDKGYGVSSYYQNTDFSSLFSEYNRCYESYVE